MALSPDVIKVVFDDVRARQSALLGLIYFVERQAMNLLRLFITAGVAMVAAFAAGVQSVNPILHSLYPSALAGLVLTTVGAAFCFRAMKTVELNLPGRGAEFWLWLLDNPHVETTAQLRFYLEDLEKQQADTRVVNVSNARSFERAKKVAVLTPPAMLLAAVVAYFFL